MSPGARSRRRCRWSNPRQRRRRPGRHLARLPAVTPKPRHPGRGCYDHPASCTGRCGGRTAPRPPVPRYWSSRSPRSSCTPWSSGWCPGEPPESRRMPAGTTASPRGTSAHSVSALVSTARQLRGAGDIPVDGWCRSDGRRKAGTLVDQRGRSATAGSGPASGGRDPGWVRAALRRGAALRPDGIAHHRDLHPIPRFRIRRSWEVRGGACSCGLARDNHPLSGPRIAGHLRRCGGGNDRRYRDRPPRPGGGAPRRSLASLGVALIGAPTPSSASCPGTATASTPRNGT